MKSEIEVQDENEYFKQVFLNIDYTDTKISFAEYESCSFTGCNFSQTDMTGTSFDNCIFKECNISNPIVGSAKFQDCEFDLCKMLGINFCNCGQLSFDLVVKNTRLLNCNFSGLKMKRSSFIDCIMEECYFDDTFLVEVDFSRTVFRSTLFHKCDLQKAKFLDAEGYSINPTTNKIQKAIFNLPGALALLDSFNIVIK